MFKLPADVEKELQKKFPDIPIEKVADAMFRSILEKSLRDGSCFIKGFGHFSAFGKWSSKMNRNVIRFKFTIALSLEKKIKTDPYYLSSIPIKSTRFFSEIDEQKKEIRKANAEAEKLAKQTGRKKSEERAAIEEVSSIINEFDL